MVIDNKILRDCLPEGMSQESWRSPNVQQSVGSRRSPNVQQAVGSTSSGRNPNVQQSNHSTGRSRTARLHDRTRRAIARQDTSPNDNDIRTLCQEASTQKGRRKLAATLRKLLAQEGSDEQENTERSTIDRMLDLVAAGEMPAKMFATYRSFLFV